MPSQPSIERSIFARVVEDVDELLGEGGVQARELPRWLEPSDLALLGQEILLSETLVFRMVRSL